MNKIGRIYGEVIDNQFSFATKEYYGGDFVKIYEKDGDQESAILVCEIVKRGISNKFLTTPDIVKYMDDNMDFQRDTLYTYFVSAIGVVKEGRLSKGKVNAIPGKSVYVAESELLKIVYGITEQGCQIGYLKKSPDCKMYLDSNMIFNPHLFIVGKTGSGKSFFMKRYIGEVQEDFWLFVPSDEYDDISHDSAVKCYREYTIELDVENISFYVNLNASEEMILKNIKFDEEKIYSIKDITDAIYDYYRNKKKNKHLQMSFDLGENNDFDLELPAYANSLISKLKNIRHIHFTKNKKKINLPKDSTVFDLGEFTQLEQECILNYYLFRLLQRCKRTKPENRKKQIVVIEEAHNYVPSVKNTLSKEILVRLSREGRKYGISLCFITQRPRFFDQTALSQAGNKIVFSLPNPEDVKHIMEDIPYYKPELGFTIQGQRTGECVIVGDAYNDILEVVID